MGARAAPAVGDRLDRYVLVRQVAEGGMGVVFEATDPELGRTVAVKVLRTRSVRAAQRLVIEARAAAALSHPNVVQVFGAGEDGGHPFIVMEFVPGRTLTAWLTEAHSAGEIVAMFSQLGEGLAAAHALGIVHRDFKPDNVLVADDGRGRVVDFGLARVGALTDSSHGSTGPASAVPPSHEVASALDDLAHDTVGDGGEGSGPTPGPHSVSRGDGLAVALTETGTVLGTPRYIAPELHAGGVPLPSADQFSFCVALYQALYDQRPYEGTTLTALAIAKHKGPVPPPAREDVSAAVQRAVLRGLSAKPADRFPDMSALVLQLQPTRGPRWRLGIGVVAAVGLLGLGGVLFSSPASVPLACQDAAAIEDTWSAARRDALERGIAGADVAYAQTLSTAIVAELDGYAARWVGGHGEACAAAVDARAFDMWMLCLEGRQDALHATVALLQAGERDVIERSHALVAGLPSVAGCEPGAAEGKLVAPPEGLSEAARAEYLRILQTLERARPLIVAARHRQAQPLVDEALAAAERVGDRRLLAEAQFTAGEVYTGLLDDTRAVELLSQSFHGAMELGSDVPAIRAASHLAWLHGWQRRDAEQAEQWRRHAEALLPRVDDARLLGKYHVDIAGVCLGARQFDAALEHARAAVELEASPATLQLLGAVERRIVSNDVARGHLDRARTMVLSSYGASHSDLANISTSIGVTWVEVGRPELAWPYFVEALDAAVHSAGPHSSAAANVRANLGRLLLELGDARAAEPYAAQALADERAARGDTSPLITEHLANLAVIEMHLPDHARAREHFSEALTSAQSRDDSYGAARPMFFLAVLALIEGDAAGEAQLEQAIEAMPSARAHLLARAASSAWVAQRPALALRFAEQTLAALGDAEADEVAQAQAHAIAAQAALALVDVAGAQHHVAQARARSLDAGPRGQRTWALIDGWARTQLPD